MASSASVSRRERAALLAASDLPRRFGRYVLLRRIAKGGMGEVMLAASLGLEGAERPVIVKTIRSEHRTDQSFKARFLDEARVQAQLEHSGVAKVIEATQEEGSGEPYVVVEYVEGRSLGEVRSRALAIGTQIGWAEAVSTIQLAAEALSHVHERYDSQGAPLSIVHRDLSPQNVMVSYGGEIKIIDFGTARGENRRCHTVSGVVYAKPGYTAPEVANGDSGDFRVDLYALGVMLWELCAGRRFLQGEASDHMAQVAAGGLNLPPIAALAEGPTELDVVIGRLTAFDRAERYATTAEAARDLARLLGQAPALMSGERGVRARAAGLMLRVFGDEPAKSRREFARLVADARKLFASAKTPSAPTPRAAKVMKDNHDGLLPGTRYRLLDPLGSGAHTVVYEAEHLDLGRRVAIKLPKDETADASSRAAEGIRHEACILAQLRFAGVCPVIDVGRTSEGVPYSVLKKEAGITLAAYAKAHAPLPVRDALAITDRILAVLELVHERQIIHRDIKPENILIADDGAITLLDFGIALDRSLLRELATPAPGRPQLQIFGTPEYMAPEQAARPNEVDARADIYALGVVLYELLTGALPFSADSPLIIIEHKTQGSPQAPSERVTASEITSEVDQLALTALSRHSSLRYENASEMRRAIHAALLAPDARRRRRRWIGRGVAAAVMLSALGVLGATQLGSGNFQRATQALGLGVSPASQADALPVRPEPLESLALNTPAAEPAVATLGAARAEPETASQADTKGPAARSLAHLPIFGPAYPPPPPVALVDSDAPDETEAVEEAEAEAAPKKKRKARRARKKDKTDDKADVTVRQKKTGRAEKPKAEPRHKGKQRDVKSDAKKSDKKAEKKKSESPKKNR